VIHYATATRRAAALAQQAGQRNPMRDAFAGMTLRFTPLENNAFAQLTTADEERTFLTEFTCREWEGWRMSSYWGRYRKD